MTDRALREALASSQRLGMLGPGSLDDAIEHAEAFVAALASSTGLVVDLGSGGGLPGLVIAVARPDLRLVLVDRRATRTDHLTRLVRGLDLVNRVTVRAEDARTLVLAPSADAVVARSFGPPSRTAEVAVRLLRAGGLLVVSEPPATVSDRWSDVAGVRRLPWPDARVAVLRCVPRETMPGRDADCSTWNIEGCLTLWSATRQAVAAVTFAARTKERTG